ncbi:hypothetical protein S7711_02525 [Stachybotrys chartarum IBT 7711]|uniref:Survival Motor Neuron Gemin2-binding domain-containing protein n=1 Tax=Stachybotrys chartarum (strain CBS 109288 / IBT 7711) TaxID=1280523 RepID=A0A084B5A9_STACB|nr:hypothetical protein S7711_02525 [Stachybotrys chartarum IBT 7711]KFA50557.1 hypothetical protein S40293_03078 [Stachybotrys chartarum IBT 40293]
MTSETIDMDQPNQDDIWDDSMLIDSWNEALKEYKKYHSIHAKGSKLKDVEKLVNSTSSYEDRPSEIDTEDKAALAVTGRLEDQASLAIAKSGIKSLTHPPTRLDNLPWFTDLEQTAPQAAAPSRTINTNPTMPNLPPPQAVLGSVRDENLKKLLMSWYYAGYYTGLYEGQQQQQQPSSQD